MVGGEWRRWSLRVWFSGLGGVERGFFCGLHLSRCDSSYDVMGRFGDVSV